MTGTKTIAERLRDYALQRTTTCTEFREITTGVKSCTGIDCSTCRKQIANTLAGMIEAGQRSKTEQNGVDVDALLELAGYFDYAFGATDWAKRIRDAVKGAKPQLPEGVIWPRFEDGELVRFGDIARVREDIGEVIEIRFHTGKCSEVTIAFEDESTATHYMVVDGPHLKRHEPEVLDADNVPIKVGDTVYKVGEHPVSGRRTVEKVERVGDDAWVWFSTGTYDFPEGLTHRKPDTQDAIDADAEEWPCNYFKERMPSHCGNCDLHPDDGECDSRCRADMNRDLLRRQRKLLGGE